MSTLRVVVVKLNKSQREYHLSEDFNCEFDRLVVTERAKVDISASMPEELSEFLPEEITQYMVKEMAEQAASHEACSIGEKLSALKHCAVEHAPDRVLLDINLARTDWSIVEATLMSIIKDYFDVEPTLTRA